MYSLIGKAVVRFSWRYLKLRYSREAGIALGLLVTGVGAAVAYFLTREVPEG